MQGGLSLAMRNSVCLSVCQSAKRLNCDETAHIIIWKNDYLSFPIQKMVGAGDPSYFKFWAKLTPRSSKKADILIDIR